MLSRLLGHRATKPLFIPLKGEYYDAFVTGAKDTEFRLYGPRWNERTCTEGREVVISRGYGKKHRAKGFVWCFYVEPVHRASPAFMACYPNAKHPDRVACIRIALESIKIVPASKHTPKE